MVNGKQKEEILLAKGCIRKDRESQQKLFEKYYGLMLGICLRYATDRDEAKDVMQDGFIKIFKNIDRFNFQGSLEGWMKRIMINNCIDHYRKRVAKPFTSSLEDAPEVSVPESANQHLNKNDLLEIVKELPGGYRTVFNMYAIEGYSHKEIAGRLEISIGTSKSQLSKARKMLQKKIEERLSYYNEQGIESK